MNPVQPTPTQRHFAQLIIRVLSVILLPPIVVLLLPVIITPLTISGVLYLVGTIAVILGLWDLVWGYRRLRYALWSGLALIIAVALIRIVLIRSTDKIKLLIMPDSNALCSLNCLIDEQDASLVSTRLLPYVGWISPHEADGLLDAMYAGYQAMAVDQSLVGSPFVRTYLNLQNSSNFDSVVIEPQDKQPTTTALIFLHGFIGNFTMPCWLMAQAVRASHAVTVCPSVNWRGDWWTSNGEATLRATIADLHRQGINRIYLSGLSNGAVGASDLAHKLTSDIAGLILISGASPDAVDSVLPVLILAGTNDERMPIDMMRDFAHRLGDHATLIEHDADHFMLAKQAKVIQAEIASWLQAH